MIFCLNLLLNTIIQNYFQESRCVIIFTDEFNTIDYTGSDPFINVKVESSSDNIPTDVIFQHFGCQEVVVKSSRPLWMFKMFEGEIRLNMERFNYRKYLFVPGNNMTENLIDVFQMPELQYVSDLLVIEECERKMTRHKQFWRHEDVIYKLWTHKYVGEANHNEKLLLDVWSSQNRSFLYHRNLYPNKLVNQMGRELRMATLHYEPYSIIGPTLEDYRGTELVASVTFAKALNMTPIPIVSREDDWGDLFDNWTGTGLMNNLITDNADIGFAALYTWGAYYHFLDLSKPLVRSGVAILVPAPKLVTGWLTPSYSYSYSMWIGVGITLIVCSLSLFYMHYFYVKTKGKDTTIAQNDASKLLTQSVFTIIKLFVVQAIAKKEIPNGSCGRYFMSVLFLSCLVLTSTYMSHFSAVMTIPKYKNPINTVEEFLESGLHWGGTDDVWIISIRDIKQQKYQAITRQYVATSHKNLREYSKNGKFAFVIERLPYRNYAVGSYIKEDVIGSFHLMKDDFYWDQCIIMARKNSILLNLLDTFILHTFEAGLLWYWQNQAISLYMDSKVQKIVNFYNYNHKSQYEVKSLKWIHVEGAFGILGVGYVIGLIVFLLEILVNKLKLRTLAKENRLEPKW